MPIHEFRCQSCDYTFEILLMSKEEMKELLCPRCQSPEVVKLMSAANVGAGNNAQPSGGASADTPKIRHRTCGSGSCSTFELPGYKK
ncbi:MAG: zinc ribbon domain-containing protein [Deltaproteobacteria bacterium]